MYQVTDGTVTGVWNTSITCVQTVVNHWVKGCSSAQAVTYTEQLTTHNIAKTVHDGNTATTNH